MVLKRKSLALKVDEGKLIQGVSKKVPLMISKKGWVIFSKTVFEFETTT